MTEIPMDGINLQPRTSWEDLPELPMGVNGSNPERALSQSTSERRVAPSFPDPEPLDLDDETKNHIIDTIDYLHRETIESRESWNKRHQDYDLMFRGALDLRGPSGGPWEGSANLHVQAPYWLVDAYSTRVVSGLWSTIPLVVGHPEEDDDQEVARDAANIVRWHLDQSRMNARAAWSRISKTRCIHGRGIGLVPWAKDEYLRRIRDGDTYETNEEGELLLDENSDPIVVKSVAALSRETRYDGPVLVPLEWDQIIEPMDGINLQPVTRSNSLGADWVGVSQFEQLSLIWSKRKTTYTYIEDNEALSSKEKWIDQSPSQDRAGSKDSNQSRSRLQDFVEGRSRRDGAAKRTPHTRSNPEFEILTWFMPLELPNENGDMEETECVFFYCLDPKALLGAFRLSDIQWKNKRPLVELDYQTVGTRRLSMGIMEIVSDLSAELDTIHNMRMDVGFATNMPFFFFNNTSTIAPEEISLRPGKGIGVDDVRNIVFPQMQSVTSFYHQEEQLLYALIERVFGVTDLFLGVSPTQGAASRHATGFVGVQQEAMARTEEIQSSDATAFSHLCQLIYEAEVQFGPEERILRLQGRDGPLTQSLTRDDIWFRGEYDFTVGANYGIYSSMMRQQQAQVLQQISQTSPFVNQDPGRRWEVENFVFHSYGFPEPSIFIGPKDAVSAGSPTKPDEENGEMDQSIYGEGLPAPVHPSDNDEEHLRVHRDHISSPAFAALGSPNLSGHFAHIQATQAQIKSKMMMSQMSAQNAMMGNQPGAQPQTQPQPNARNVASLEGVESAGAMGDVTQRVGDPTGAQPPQ